MAKPKLVIPRFTVELENAKKTVRAMTEELAESVKERIRAGTNLPPTKDGRPYYRTGALHDATRPRVSGGKRGASGSVAPRGKHPTGKRNAEIAGILRAPPKDKRSVNGNRGIYVVYQATPREEKRARSKAARLVHLALVEKRTRIRHRSR